MYSIWKPWSTLVKLSSVFISRKLFRKKCWQNDIQTWYTINTSFGWVPELLETIFKSHILHIIHICSRTLRHLFIILTEIIENVLQMPSSLQGVSHFENVIIIKTTWEGTICLAWPRRTQIDYQLPHHTWYWGNGNILFHRNVSHFTCLTGYSGWCFDLFRCVSDRFRYCLS